MDPLIEEDVDVWPGFVDVLASVVLFLLLGFVTLILAQDFRDEDERQTDARLAEARGDEAMQRLNASLASAHSNWSGKTNEPFRPDDCVRDGWTVTCTFRELLRFDTARWTVQGDGLTALDGFAGELRALCEGNAVERIVVEGHTDPVSMEDRTRDMTNWELSSARAGNVVRYLQGVGGIPGSLLEAVGHAEMNPPDGNQNAPYERWRRVAIRVHLKGSLYDEKRRVP